MATGNTTSKHIFKSNICQTRQLKVCKVYSSHQTNQKVPIGQIHLKGHWLIKAGFEIGTPIKVRVMYGCLVVTVKAQPEPSLSGFNQLKQNEQRVIKDILGAFLKLKKK